MMLMMTSEPDGEPDVDYDALFDRDRIAAAMAAAERCTCGHSVSAHDTTGCCTQCACTMYEGCA